MSCEAVFARVDRERWLVLLRLGRSRAPQGWELFVVHLSLTHTWCRASTPACEARVRTAPISPTRLEIPIRGWSIAKPWCTGNGATFKLNAVRKSMHELALVTLSANPAQPESA